MAARVRARRLLATLLLASVPVASCHRPTPRTLPTPPPPPIVRPDEPVPPPPCQRIVRIVVSKRERRLRAHCERGERVEMRAALGRSGDGPKRIAGDTRTPEGDYRVSGAPRASRFHLFVPLDYPSLVDAQEALLDDRLSRSDYARIAAAHRADRAPPGDTPLGGEIGLHGEGARWQGDSEHIDWTQGCIAVSDAEIEFLAERLEVGTPVRIEP